MDTKVQPTYPDSSKSEEIVNSITHGIGIVLGLVALVLLLIQGLQLDNRMYLIAVTVYAASFIWTYTASTLYHSFYKAEVKRRNLLHLLDHTAIYIFIAGTYTPVALFGLPDGWNIGILASVWALAVLGVLSKIFSIGKHRKLSLIFYLLMGWMLVVAAKPLVDFAAPELMYMIIAGGAFYSIGTVFFSLRKLRHNHAIWHLCVMGGSICHFLGIYFYLNV